MERTETDPVPADAAQLHRLAHHLEQIAGLAYALDPVVARMHPRGSIARAIIAASPRSRRARLPHIPGSLPGDLRVLAQVTLHRAAQHAPAHAVDDPHSPNPASTA